MKKLIPLVFVTLSAPIYADTIGHWRFDDVDAVAGGDFFETPNVVDPGDLDAFASGGFPIYSADVPLPQVFDPVSGETYTNSFSFDASGSGDIVTIPGTEAFDSSFTVEFFVKFVGEPASYEPILRRQESNDLKWQIDFDHGANQAFGRLRTRWDTPAGLPDGVAETGVDENVNFVVGPQGNVNAPKVYVDTGAKNDIGEDVGPQNTGDPLDYVYDSTNANENPFEDDVALQGDGINDVDEWHHVALTFNQDTGEIRFYFDYFLAQSRTLADTEGDGYTHPFADIAFGKLTATPYGLLLDELRYSNTTLTPGSFLRAPREGGSNTIAHWRIDDEFAAAGEEITFIENSVSLLHDATPVSAAPLYSTDVPAAQILDPLTSTTYPNQFSMDATLSNARMRVPDDIEFDTSFTIEMFIKLVGEPGGYNTFIRRREQNDLRWQIDFDHALRGAFGRLRTRFDTPAGIPDNVNEPGVDENINFVVGPAGGATLPADQRIWIDTATGDGLLSSYPVDGDWAAEGDGINDVSKWHHVAVTFDQETGTIGFYFDYAFSFTGTLLDTEGDGYTHPSAPIEFGKFAGDEYGLLFDEVRYSGSVLIPSEFLQAVVDNDSPAFRITAIAYLPGATEATITWLSTPGKTYAVDRADSLGGPWVQLAADLAADTESTGYTDTTLPSDLKNAYYRVRQLD